MASALYYHCILSDTDLLRRYVEDGYLVAEDLVEASTVEELRAEIPLFGDGTYRVTNPPPDPTKILAVHFPHRVSKAILASIHYPGVVEVLKRIVGAHLPHWDRRVKCMQSMLFLKPSGFPGQAWHQDERYIPTRDRSLVGAWIALDDATETNGCLRVIPGSHRMGRLWPTRAHHHPEEFDLSDEAYGFEEAEETCLEVGAGSVVFFNGYLLHRSLRNRSDTTRRALVNHYMNSWSNLPWRTGADRMVDAAIHDNRAVMNVAGEDPYPERGIDEDPGEVFVRPWSDEMPW